jgi:hypothetical protein
VLLALGAAVALVGSTVLGGAAAASAGAATPTSTGALIAAAATTPSPESFAACVAGGGTAQIVMLVDESGSLTESDPDLARVASATYFVDRLAQTVARDQVDVELEVAVFGHSYSTVVDWTTLGADTVGSVRAGIASLADRTGGMDTDYWTALDGARKDLAARAAVDPSAVPCQAVVLFTDGKLDFFPRTTDDERAAYGTEKVFAPGIPLTSDQAAADIAAKATDDLCRGGGLADQLRSSGVTLFGVGLNGVTSEASDFAFIESVVTGRSSDGSQQCGQLVDPAPGEFHLATDIDSLLFVFDDIASPGSAPIRQETGICQFVACTDQSHRFVLDASTPDVRILATSDVPNLQAAVLLPSGELVELADPGTGAATTLSPAGTQLVYTWESPRTVSIDLTQSAAPDAAWTGLWQLAFTDPSGTSGDKRSRSSIHISGDAKPAWTGFDPAAELHTGENVDDARFGIVTRQGEAVDPASILGSIQYSVVFQDADGTQQTVVDTSDKAEIGAPVSIDLSDAAIGPALLTMRLQITTAPATTPTGTVDGTVLDPVTVSVPLAVLAPAEFPVIGDDVDFGEATGSEGATGVLAVSGSGCVWLASDAAPTIVASPDGLGRIAVDAPGADSASSCVDAASGEGLTLELSTENGGNGSLNGSVPVMIAPAGSPDDAIEVDVAFTASLVKPINATNFWLALVVALVLGPGLPLGILYIAKWIVARIPSRPLAALVVDVAVEGDQVLRSGRPFALGREDVTRIVPIDRRGSRRLDIDGFELVAHAGASPASTGFVVVDLPGGSTASGEDPAADRSGVRARLPLAVHNSWVVAHTPGAPASAATLLVLLGADIDARSLEDFGRRIARETPAVLAALIEAEGVEPESAAAPVSVFGGGDPSSSAPPSSGPTSPWGTT